MLDDKFVYVFIRQDLSIELQLVHIAHAVRKMMTHPDKAEWDSEQGIPAIIIIGVPNLKSLDRVYAKLDASNSSILFSMFTDPDYDFGMTAICTQPLSNEQRSILSNYRLWNAVHNLSLANGAITTQTGKPYKDYSDLSADKK